MRGEAVRLGIDDEVDVALPVQRDVLALVPGDRREAHLGEQAAQQFGIGRGIFDEFEAVGTHRILKAQRAELDGRGGGHDSQLLYRRLTAPRAPPIQASQS